MDFDLSEEQIILQKTVRKFLEKEILPIVEDFENRHELVPLELLQKLVPFGFFGGLLSEEEGGMELDHLTYLLMMKELSRVWPSMKSIVSISNEVLTFISRYGTPEQKAKYLPDMLAAKTIGCFALTEPNVGSDAVSIETSATLKDGEWVLNGEKMFITNGSMADIGLVFAQTDKSKRSKGITAFIVDKSVDNFEARPIQKMGNQSSPIASLTFDNCRIPEDRVLGGVGQGIAIAFSFLSLGRTMIAFVSAGIAEAALEAAQKYAIERYQFGKQIGGFQLVQAMLAEMAAAVEASNLLAYQAATLLDQGKPCAKQVSIAKMFASEACLKVCDMAIQIHGGYGYTKEFPVERYYRDARFLTIAEGTSQIQRLLIGREMLGISALK